MKAKVKQRDRVSSTEPPRTKRMTCLLSDEESRIVDRYLSRYHITNKGRWMRETILAFISKTVEEDYPTLFNEHDMRR